LKILKIGGSVITEKKKNVFNVARLDKIREICEVIARNRENLILVHGVGSFGHPYVEKYKLKERKDVYGVAETHIACKKLNEVICETLLDLGVPVLPIHPLTFKFDFEFLKEMIDEGFLLVFHGDMVYNKGRFEVISGDEIVVKLADNLNVSRIGFATDVDGILIDGKVSEKFDKSMLKFISLAVGKSDVTGGMRGKLEKIFNIKRRCDVFVFKGTAENIERFLRGERVGTKVIL